MFREHRHPNGQITLHSTLLQDVGVPHAFTTAAGGLHIGTAAHLSPVLEVMNLHGRAVVMTRQVHGCHVTAPDARADEADAHVTDDPGELVAVRTADCVPVLLATHDVRCVAAVHAGWRGLLLRDGDAQGVLDHAVGAVCRRIGVEPGHVLGAIGPCISVEHYEVGGEFHDLMNRAGHGDHLCRGDDGRLRIDLRAIARQQLESLGMPVERIDVAPHCTFRDAELFHSYRRQGKGCGHMAAFVGPVNDGATR